MTCSENNSELYEEILNILEIIQFYCMTADAYRLHDIILLSLWRMQLWQGKDKFVSGGH
jgi:hypothetical protein